MSETSYNGWPASPDPKAIGIVPLKVAGREFPGGVKGGAVAALFRYFLANYHLRVESLGLGSVSDEWGYAYRQNRNAANLSCHASGTAVDVNATRHPNGKAGTLSVSQVTELRRILKECGGVIRWGGDFTTTKDEMHYEINGTPEQVQRVVAYRQSLTWFTRDLLPGMEGGDVHHVQSRLRIPRTYLYDEQTVAAVKRTQARLGLPTSGKVVRGLAYLIG